MAAYKTLGNIGTPTIPHNDFDAPFSTDWMTVLKWILDRMYLADIPPNYLISDSSLLPQEGIRFFAIDRNWTDALVDGALSVANDLERSEDRVRQAIQHAIKQCFDAPSRDLMQKSPLPQFGFLLRSELLAKIPDMVITMDPAGSDMPSYTQEKPILIRHELLNSTVMMCLFDRIPDGSSFQSSTISQPLHEQSFSIGFELDNSELKVDIKDMHIGEGSKQAMGKGRASEGHDGNMNWQKGETPTPEKPPVFVWGDDQSNMRFMLTDNFANLLHRKVQEGLNNEGVGDYAETNPSPSLVAHQLSEPNW